MERVPRSSAGVFVIVTLLTVALWVLLVTRVAELGAGPIDQPAVESKNTGEEPLTRMPPRTERTPAFVARSVEDEVRMQFVDELTSAPIRGVLVLPMTESRVVERHRVLATSDDDGNVSITDDERELRAVHPDYQSLTISRASPGSPSPSIHRLRPGSSVDVTCVLPTGQPLAEIPLALSRVVVDDSIADRLRVRGAQGDREWIDSGSATGIRIGTTDSQGMARFRGLLPGRYVLRSLALDHAVVRGEWYGSGFEVPMVRSMEITLAPVLVMSLVVEGDELISYQYDCPAGLMTTGTLGGYDLDARQSRGKEIVKNGLFLLGADAGVQDRSIHIDAFLRRSGRQTLQADLVPWRADVVPSVVRLPTQNTEQCGFVRLTVRNPSSKEIDVRLIARSESETDLFCSIPIEGGSTTALSPGDYEVFAPPVLSQFFPRSTFRVLRGETAEVQVSMRHELVPFVMKVEDELSGDILTGGVVTIEHRDSRSSGRFSSRSLGQVVHWFPLGSLSVEAAVFGYEPGSIECSLEAGHTRTSPQVVHLPVKRQGQ